MGYDAGALSVPGLKTRRLVSLSNMSEAAHGSAAYDCSDDFYSILFSFSFTKSS